MVGHSEYSLIPALRQYNRPKPRLACASLLGCMARPGHDAHHQCHCTVCGRESCQRTCPQLLILQHIERCELVRVHTLHTQNLYARPRKPTLRRLRGTLHEQHHWRRSDGAVNCAADLIREASSLEGCEEACAWEGARGAGAGCGAESLASVNRLLVSRSADKLMASESAWRSERATYLGDGTS